MTGPAEKSVTPAGPDAPAAACWSRVRAARLDAGPVVVVRGAPALATAARPGCCVPVRCWLGSVATAPVMRLVRRCGPVGGEEEALRRAGFLPFRAMGRCDVDE